MVIDESDSDLVLPPAWFGAGVRGAAWRASLVFVLGYLFPAIAFGRSGFSGGVQWMAILLTYFLVCLAAFRFLEARKTKSEDAALDGSEVAPSAGVLDEVVTSNGDAHNHSRRPTAWSPDVLHQLDWKHVVNLCLAYFEDRFVCKAGKLADDGSVEIKLYKDGGELPVAIVHCRAWGEHEVGLDMLEDLSVRMAQELIAKGFCMGYAAFSDEAKSFAKEHAITLLDDAMFVSMLNRLPDDRKSQLLALALEGDYASPTCPVCGLKMIVRQNEQARYWGCRAYPRCKGVLAMKPKRPTPGGTIVGAVA